MLRKVTMMGHGPSRLHFYERLFDDLPLSVVCDDARGLSSGSMDCGGKASIKALGEFAERTFFYNLVESEGKIPTSEIDRNFVDRMNEMSPSSIAPDGKYHTVTLWNLFDASPIMVPVNFVSLGFRYRREPHCGRDTSGCSVHSRFDACLRSSLYEFVERQLLIKYWLTAHNVHEVVLDRVHPIAKLLSKTGEVKIFDLSDRRIGSYCFFIVFLGFDAPVWFSSSLAAGPNADDALISAMEELWQIYSFVRKVGEESIALENIRDNYQKSYLKYNTSDTHKFFEEKCRTIEFKSSEFSQVYDIDATLSGLKAYSKNVYFYHSYCKILGRSMHAIRTLSPDFFMHIQLSGNVNMKNKFSSTFEPIDPSRTGLDLPFP